MLFFLLCHNFHLFRIKLLLLIFAFCEKFMLGLYEKTNSILSAMIVHALFNFIAVLLTFVSN
ncbi:hypothetical protein ACT7DA_02805 [Bacillus pacificus]